MTHLDEMLQELIALEQDVKIKYKRIEEIKAWCKEQGSFATDHHVCSVKEHTRTGLAGLDVVAKALGRDLLEDLDLIRVSQFLTVHVSKRCLELDYFIA